METRQIEQLVIAALEDIKAKDIEVIDTSKLTPLFESIIIACGDSNRQVRSLARHVGDKVREAGVEILSTEGEDSGEWILVDLGAVSYTSCNRPSAATTTSKNSGAAKARRGCVKD